MKEKITLFNVGNNCFSRTNNVGWGQTEFEGEEIIYKDSPKAYKLIDGRILYKNAVSQHFTFV